MTTKTLDVISVCNALMDVVYEATDADLQTLQLHKGRMQMIDSVQQEKLHTYFSGKQTSTELGGSSLNAVRALALLHRSAAFAGVVSDDMFGQKIRAAFEQIGIASRLQNSTADVTGTCIVAVTPDGERTMSTNLAASCLFGPEIVPYQDIARAKILHISGYQWGGTDSQKAAILKAMDHAKEHHTLVSFDLADPFMVIHNRDAFAKTIVSHADIVFANEEESRLLFDLSPEETGKKIAAAGAIAVMKLGKRGAYIHAPNAAHGFYQDSVLTSVVDTTGAGDMFAAGFLFGLLQEKPLSECALSAATLASDVISRYGATLSEDVLQKLRSR